MRGLSLAVASGGHSSSQCTGLSLSRPLLLRSTGSRRAGSVIVAHGPSCSAACGIFPNQGLNPCALHWQADSQPLHHQGSPWHHFLKSLQYTQLSRRGHNTKQSQQNRVACLLEDMESVVRSAEWMVPHCTGLTHTSLMMLFLWLQILSRQPAHPGKPPVPFWNRQAQREANCPSFRSTAFFSAWPGQP